MITLIAVMFFGVLAGYFLRGAELLQHLNRPITATILILIFLMGAGVGSNPYLLKNLWGLGGQAFLLAFAATLGSVLMAALVWRFFFREGAPK